MSRRGRDPLEGVTRLLVDGTNLLHQLVRRGDAVVAPTALISRLRAAVEPQVRVVVVLDGPPETGLGVRRIASGVDVRHAGRRSADDVLVEMAADDPDATLAVTDDGALAARLHRLGARTARNAWLIDQFERQRLRAPSMGRPTQASGSIARPPGHRPPASPGSPPGSPWQADPSADAEAARSAERWRPGRGATRKRGNPHRGRPPDQGHPPSA